MSFKMCKDCANAYELNRKQEEEKFATDYEQHKLKQIERERISKVKMDSFANRVRAIAIEMNIGADSMEVGDYGEKEMFVDLSLPDDERYATQLEPCDIFEA